MAPQNESAKDMHAQLSAWELLVGLHKTGSERFWCAELITGYNAS